MFRILSALAIAIPSITLACTGIQLKTLDGSYVNGRTVEFGVVIPAKMVLIPRNHPFTGKTPNGPGLSYPSKYAATGLIGFDELNILDGINEKGLSVGAFYFPTFASYATIDATNQTKALSPTDFPNWILTNFATVDEVRGAIEKGEAVIAPTRLEGWQDVPPFHYIVYDKSGKALVIEPIDGKLVLFDNHIGAFTNSPSFDWHITNLRNYISLNPRNVPPVKIDGTTFQALGQGSGMLGLPGDFTPPSRFVRATVFSQTAIPSKGSQEGVFQVFHILNNFDIPVGVARDVEGGKIATDSTLLTVARDPNTLRFFWRTYDDQTIRSVDLNKFNANGTEVKTIGMETKQPVVEMN